MSVSVFLQSSDGAFFFFFFFFNDTATTEIYTLSLHDALPISRAPFWRRSLWPSESRRALVRGWAQESRRADWKAADRKSTRLNSSHANISYAVFCLKKKKKRKRKRRIECPPESTETPEL